MRRFLLFVAALCLTSAVTTAQTKASYKTFKPKATPVQKVSRMGEENINANIENANPGIVREPSFGELDFTTYDWQSNSGPITRTIVWPDGKINFAYTYSATNSSTQQPDRGTGIGTYDANTGECIPLNSRVESEKTGFGSIARYGENGIVLAAHTATTVGCWIIEDKDNIPQGTLDAVSYLPLENELTWANVMTSGENRDIIHIVCTPYPDDLVYEGVGRPLLYFRSTDGGQTWDKQNVVLPYMTAEDFVGFSGSNDCYWLETTENNRLTLIVNTSWIDGMAIWSEDNGETWNKTQFYEWPDPFAQYAEEDSVWIFYPRYVSAVWDKNDKLNICYEWNGTGSLDAMAGGTYYASIGSIAFWSETLPYHGCDTTPAYHEVGQPFIIDTAYLFNDIYASWWRWSDALHPMWPENVGYVTGLDDEGNPEDPYEMTEFNITDYSLHGSYNGGITQFPAICYEPSTDYIVTLWSAMDENNVDGNGNYFFKLFARGSADGGLTWTDMKQLTTDFSFSFMECTYNQAVIYNHQLIVASQMDGTTGSFIQSDDADATDNMYQVLVFDLAELFDNYPDGVEEVEATPTIMTLYPNPASQMINVSINKSSDIVIYDIVGQAVKSFKGHMGINTVDVSNFTPGVYFMSIGENTQKFVVK